MESTKPDAKAEDNDGIGKKGCLGCFGVIAVIAVLAFLGSLLPDPPPPTPEEIEAWREVQRQREIDRGHDARLEAHRQAAKECVDEWTGSVFEVGHAIRDRLNDPDSYEHDSTRITDLSAWQRARDIVKDDSMPGKAKAEAVGELQALPRPPFDYTGGGSYYVVTEFRARNRFGGVVRGIARATLDEDCEVHTLISVD